MRLNALQNFGF